MTFDLDKQQARVAGTYVLQHPDPNCVVCGGKGNYDRHLQLCLKTQLVPSLCECIVAGMANYNGPRRGVAK